MTERVTPQFFAPLSDNAEDGGPHLAATDLSFAQQTHMLVRRQAGNRFTICYTGAKIDTFSYSDTNAPYADVSDSTSWTGFLLGESSAEQATLQIPWYVSDAHDYPVMRIRMVSDSRYISYETRVQKSTFVQATSTQNFDAPEPLMPFFGETSNDWALGTVWEKGTASFFTTQIELKGLALPSAPRDILLAPQVKISQRGISALGDVAGEHRVYISQLMIYDDWDP